MIRLETECDLSFCGCVPPIVIFQIHEPYKLSERPSLTSLTMSLVGRVAWKCILCWDLETLEVYTIVASEGLVCVYYLGIRKLVTCILCANLNTLEYSFLVRSLELGFLNVQQM